MKKDPVVEEIRNEREKFAEEFKYDLDSIFEYLQELETKNGHLVDLPILADETDILTN